MKIETNFNLICSLELMNKLVTEPYVEGDERIIGAVLEDGYFDIELNVEYTDGDASYHYEYFVCGKFGDTDDDWDSIDYIDAEVLPFKDEVELQANMQKALDDWLSLKGYDRTKPADFNQMYAK